MHYDRTVRSVFSTRRSERWRKKRCFYLAADAAAITMYVNYCVCIYNHYSNMSIVWESHRLVALVDVLFNKNY